MMSDKEVFTLADIDLLTESECLAVRSVVHKLRKFWTQRHPALPFYTLGTASYMDAVQDKQDYYSKAKYYNPILRAHLGWLYNKLSVTLAKILKAPVCYQDVLALPGFHIFLSHKAFEQPIASIHRDLQYELLKWKSPEKIDFSQTISFTLAIALPKFGGGLYLWDLHHDEFPNLTQPDIKRLIGERKKSFHAYKLGKLALHSGHLVHQIAPAQNVQPEDERITIQGHGFPCEGVWQFYW